MKVGLHQDQTYFVHSGVLSQLRGISSHVKSNILALPDVTSEEFELALGFLYSGNYTCSHPFSEEQLEMHSILYCFASRHNIKGLIDLSMRNVRGLQQVAYLNILSTAQRVYPKLQEDDRLYRDFFVDETKKAMMEDISLVQEPRILDLFGQEKGHLTRDLFVALSGCVRPDDALTPATSVSSSPPSEVQNDVLLKSQKAQEPWADYLTSCYDGDQMEIVGKALGAALLTDIWRFFRWDISYSSTLNTSLFDPAIKDMKKAGGATSKVLKEVTVNLLERVSKDVGSGRCPNRDKHLTTIDGEWAWESCTICKQDRELLATRFRDFVTYKGCTGGDVDEINQWTYKTEGAMLKPTSRANGNDVDNSAQEQTEDSPAKPVEPAGGDALPVVYIETEHCWSDGDSSSDGEYEFESESEGDSEFWLDEEDVDLDREAETWPVTDGNKAERDQPHPDVPHSEPQIKDNSAPITEVQYPSGVGLKDAS